MEEDEATQTGQLVNYSLSYNLLQIATWQQDAVPTSAASILRTPGSEPYAYELVATQQVIDPRRLGQANSGLNNEDLADIFCILHPSSLPAHKSAALIRELTPQHTISTQDGVKIRERDSNSENEPGTFELAAQGLTSCDIVLRLSAKLKNTSGGYLFGRNKQRCDFVLGRDDEVKRVSNIHFRIYINEYGTIMLEDQSTNGTAVDGILLRAKDKENGRDYRHTLEQGSIIVLTMTPPEEDFRFIVRIPQRDEESDMVYRQNLTNYFHRIQNANLERQRQTRGIGPHPHEPPNIFATPDAGTPDPSMSSVGRYFKEWRGGSKYNKVGTIGKGAFAVVYKMTAKFDGVPYAAKELEKRRFMKNGILDQKVDNEMRIMQRIKHYVEHIDWEEYLYIIMEYIPGGDLGSLIHRRGHLPESDVNTMASQLLSALKYLHSGGITHRDVKPDNILIFNFSPFHVKLTDFGLSKMVDSEETFLRTFCGTLLYCAPEVYSEYREYDHAGRRNPRGIPKKSLPPQRYDDAVDIWSLAGVLFYTLCGSPPYPVKNGTTYQELLNHIMTQPLDIRPLQQFDVSENGIKFVRSMLHTRPEHRATLEELENSIWLGGEGSLEMSIEDDEVDMIGDDCVDPQLQNEASQLSINDEQFHQIDDSQDTGDVQGVSDLTEIRRVIPSSFNSDDNSNESFGFANAPIANGRLFGEVTALASSGALDIGALLPTPVNHFKHDAPSAEEFSQDGKCTQSDPSIHSPRIKNGTQYPQSAAVTMAMPPPPPPTYDKTVNNSEADERATRSSSLMGAESLVGHLNMHSPAAATSPPGAPTPPAMTAHDTNVSLRRPREDDEEETINQPWRPHDLPPKKRRRSQREIDMVLPPSVFWDPKDRSTHHNNYPPMSVIDLQNYKKYAEGKGELFEPGQKTFDTTMLSFRGSRSPSLEPDTRARSEPIREGRRLLMKRDERNLGSGLAEKLKTIEPRLLSERDYIMPATARGSDEPPDLTMSNDQIDVTLVDNQTDVTMANDTISAQQPVVGNDFQPPKRILAKLLATSDSCLPTFNLNITDNFTSWGRGFKNTARFANGQDTRVPKYAFKMLLFKRGVYRPASLLDSNDEQMTFYISTKSSVGIKVNGILLESVDSKGPLTPSRFWAELRHGDVLTVWWSDVQRRCTRFRFECYWGNSKTPRQEGQPFQILPGGDLVDEIEDACSAQERIMLGELERREEENQKNQETRRHEQHQKVDVNQSFARRPASAHLPRLL
ncbi:Serine-kinase 1 [Hyphodiscus hymeniophilus]|uniref:non-specific serine/threonine protein kinase n=1 Tax=Hyphodiscus hymeniophilus TaxID=353542 RepID=A0A9P6VHY3_9HELO|nr:Serine-kinase 1 [Hyphodiscus hymeniophilus]